MHHNFFLNYKLLVNLPRKRPEIMYFPVQERSLTQLLASKIKLDDFGNWISSASHLLNQHENENETSKVYILHRT